MLHQFQRLLKWIFKKVPEAFQESFKSVCMVFQQCFSDISREFWRVFYHYFNGISRVLPRGVLVSQPLNRDFIFRWFQPNVDTDKNTYCQYLGLEAKIGKSKTTLLSQTFEFAENKVTFILQYTQHGPLLNISIF